jgi:hypothetical protein
MGDRCHLVYAVAPATVSARQANDLLNDYVGDRSRGVVVYHDHFTGSPHGGVAVFWVRDDAEAARIHDPGPLAGWEVRSHALTFSLAPRGFVAQAELTMEEYAGSALAELEEAEADDPRYWWRRRATQTESVAPGASGRRSNHP